MRNFTIKTNLALMLGLIGVVSTSAIFYVFFLLASADDDTQILDALGRQRMLSQSMGKAIIGYATAQNTFSNIQQNVAGMNSFITSMRGTYTKSIIKTAKQTGLAISMTPEAETHPAVPFPATFTRKTNEVYQKNANLSVDIIAENPINPDQGYQTEADREAGQFLKAKPKEIFFATEENDKGLFLHFYTSDIAVVQGCADCHTRMEGIEYKVGDQLGIRRFTTLFSSDVVAGKSALSPSAKEFDGAKTLFVNTLNAVKNGGDLPLNADMSKVKTIDPLVENEMGAVIQQTEQTFNMFLQQAQKVFANEVHGVDQQKTIQEIISLSNQLRANSHSLVSLFSEYSHQKQDSLKTSLLLAGSCILLVLLLTALYVAKGVIKPIEKMTGFMGELANGNLEGTVPGIGRHDEVGHMADAVEVFQGNSLKLLQIEAAREATERRNQRSIRSEILALNNAMSEEVERAVTDVTQHSEDLISSSSELVSTADNTSLQTQTADAASQAAAENVQTVASATEELSSSVAEISTQVSHSTEVAAGAVEEAEQTHRTIQGLVAAADEVGQVIDLITNIADQTNLLALNATIEAARAGEAGKGFAVVASEVKNLANQTAKATDQISQQISNIQGATSDAASAIERVGQTISSINEISSAISAAVEQQGAATQEIARNIEEASAGTRQVSANISETAKGAITTKETAENQAAIAKTVGELINKMYVNLTEVMSSASDPQESRRYTINSLATVSTGTEEKNCILHEITRSGVGILDRELGMDQGATFDIDVPNVGAMNAVVVAITDESTHIRFDMNDEMSGRLNQLIDQRFKSKSA